MALISRGQITISIVEDGADGRSVTSTDVEFAQSSSATTAPTTGWQTTSPTWVNDSYIWQRVKTIFSTGEIYYSPAVNVTGAQGDEGRGIVSITEQYYLSTSKESLAGGSWSDTSYTWSSGKYIWTRSKITYSSGMPLIAYTDPYCDSSWEAVNEIQVGTVNLLTGASNGLGWTSVGEYADRVFKKVLPAETTEVYFYSQYLPVLEVGATYTLAFDIKAEGDFNRTEIYILSSKYSTNGALFNAQISGTTDEYQRAVIQFVPDSDYTDLTDVRVRFDIDNTITTSTRGGATLWIKEPMMVKGNVAPESFLIPPDDIFEDISKAQAVADAITEKAASEGWATKLTYIDSTGIFTGELSANTVNALQINASQITAGTIDAARIDTVSLKSTLITASNINALTLDVVKGNIGGWAIASGSISAGNLVISSASKRVVVYSAAGSISSGQRTQIYYNSDTDYGIYSTDSSGSVVFRLGSTNSVAGWSLTTSTISKGSVILGSDGSIYNTSNKWKLANDGSGLVEVEEIKPNATLFD